VPTGGFITWQSSNTSFATVSCSTCPQTNLVWNDSNSGFVTLTAQVNLPCGIVLNETANLYVGLPYTSFTIESYPWNEPNCFEIWGIYEFRATVASGPQADGWQWGYRQIGVLGEVLYPYNTPFFTFIPEQSGTYEIFVRPKNACGTGTTESMRTLVVYDYCGFGLKSGEQTIKVFPNPASATINLDVQSITDVKAKTAGPVKIELFDIGNGRSVRTWNFDYLQKLYSLNVQDIGSGTYFIRLVTTNGTSGTKVIIQ